jgi:hypothetical protein
MPVMELPRFWDYLKDAKIAVDAKGVIESWVAPVVKMVAPQGFGESVWIDEIPKRRVLGQERARRREILRCSPKARRTGSVLRENAFSGKFV